MACLKPLRGFRFILFTPLPHCAHQACYLQRLELQVQHCVGKCGGGEFVENNLYLFRYRVLRAWDTWVVDNLPSLARSCTEAMLGGKYCVVCVNTGESWFCTGRFLVEFLDEIEAMLGLWFCTERFLLEFLDEIEAMLVTFYNKRSYYRGTL